VWEGKGLQKNGVDHAEDGGIGAYAECQHTDHYRGEAGVVPEIAKGVAGVGCEFRE